MEAAQENILNLSAEEIYQKYSTFFDNVFCTNFYLNIDYPKYKEMVCEEIENSKIDYNGKIGYELFIKKRILQKDEDEEKYKENDVFSLYISDINRLNRYDKDNELELIDRAQHGDIEARNQVMEGYLKLVISFAKRFQKKGLPFEDLIQEGNIGLIRAIEKYDPSIGTKFSTYAVWWIVQNISRELANKSNLVRLPVHLYDKVSEYRKTYYKLSQLFGREATMEEIASEMNLTVEAVEKLSTYNSNTKPKSLNEPIYEEEDAELQNVIPDDALGVEERTINKTFKEDVDDFLENSKLTNRELDVLRLRCGFINNRPYTLEEVGKKYGITRERVRQIENRALNKLRSSKNVFNFIDYMDNPKEAFNNIKKVFDVTDGNKASNMYRVQSLQINPDGTLEKKEIDTLFGSFNEYSKPKIMEAVSRLSILDQFFVFYRFGGNLENPHMYELTDNQIKYYENVLLPKIAIELRKNDNNSITNSTYVSLETNTFTRSDLIALRTCFKNCKRQNKAFNYSYNHYFIDRLTTGFINRKNFSPSEIMAILHLTEEEYNNCINEDNEFKKSLKDTKRLMKKI